MTSATYTTMMLNQTNGHVCGTWLSYRNVIIAMSEIQCMYAFRVQL